MRFFRSSEAVYEQVRQQLDAAWGNPSLNGTITCIEPAETAPRDGEGRVVLAVRDEFVEFEAVAYILPSLLQAGHVEEITEAHYQAALPPPVP